MTKPKTKASKPSDFSVPDVLATPKPAPDNLPTPDDKPIDMLAYVNKKRAERETEEANAARINAEAVAKERGPSEEEIAGCQDQE